MTPSLEHTFEAALELHDFDGGVFLLVPFNVAEVYGTNGTFAVMGTLDGFPIRLPLYPTTDGHHELRVPKEVRRAIGKTWGEIVQVTIQPDTEDIPDLPKELVLALSRTGLRTRFDALPYSQRKEISQRIARAKKTDARRQRVQEVLDSLDEGE